MSRLSQFSPPANVKDFADSPQQQEQMNAAWSGNVNRWVEAAMVGDVWDLVNYGPRPAFYNPLVTDTPSTSANVAITWNAFPGRLQALFPDASDSWQQWADAGVPASSPVTMNLCSGQTIPPATYGPTGPRGWQDEYCEWSVTRNNAGNITSVMFTCENPEYWFTLWQVDPGKVLSVYQTLVNPGIQMADLCLCDANGHPVLDPVTNGPVYNPLNRWNYGTQTLANAGGAVHLTSSPNTLGAEFDLAAAGSMPRAKNGDPITSASALVCCAKFGRIGRHSDPTIGQTVNQLANYTAALPQPQATLTNPAGLYMQTPDFSAFQTPDGTPASEFWTVVRGELADPKVENDIDRILHAKFEVPPGKGYSVSDITINGAKIAYGSQIVATIDMALMATAFPNSGVTQEAVGATVTATDPSPAVVALQSLDVFVAYRNLELASNEAPLSIPILAYALTPGQQVSNVALLLNTSQTPDNPVFTVQEGGVRIEITGKQYLQNIELSVYLATISVDAGATVGDRTILAAVPGMPETSQAAIGVLTVAGSAARSPVQLSNVPAKARPKFSRSRA